MKKFNSFNKTIERLSCVRRFSSHLLAKDENVLEHTGKVALLCLHIGSELAYEGFVIHNSELLSKALLHDIEESVTGDIIHPVKYASPGVTKVFKEVEYDIAESIFEESFESTLPFALWEDAKDGAEGSIVAFVDVLCALYKMEDEIINRGNASMKNAVSQTSIETLKEKFHNMRQYFPESKTMEHLEVESIAVAETIGLLTKTPRWTNKL